MLLAISLALGGCTLPLNRELVKSPNTLAADPSHPELALLELRLAEHFGKFGAAPPTTCVRFAAGPDSYPTPYARFDEGLERRIMLRFPDVAPYDRCVEARTVGRTKFHADRDTGEPAAMVDVHDLQCETVTRCTGWAGYVLDERRNGWRFYEARFSNGKWRVREADLGIVLT